MILDATDELGSVGAPRERLFNPSFSALKAGLCLPFIFCSWSVSVFSVLSKYKEAYTSRQLIIYSKNYSCNQFVSNTNFNETRRGSLPDFTVS